MINSGLMTQPSGPFVKGVGPYQGFIKEASLVTEEVQFVFFTQATELN